MRKLVLLLLVAAGAGRAFADEVDTPPASCFAHPERWSHERGKAPPAMAGERFLADMDACDKSFATVVREAVRQEIQEDETQKFYRQSRFVVTAYAIAWVLLAIAGLALWLRQRRLLRDLAELEARLRAAGPQS